MTAPRAAIYTLGCRLNQAESSLLADRLCAAGYTLAAIGDAGIDLAIINSCTVTAEADAKSRKALRAVIRRNPGAFVCVVGCYSQVAADKLARIPGVDLVLGSADKLEVLDFVHHAKNAAPVVALRDVDGEAFRIPSPAAAGPVHKRVNLKIQEGCATRCTYCIVPDARGKPRSRVFDDAVEEARQLIARGAREIVVTGVNVGAYAHEGRRLPEMADAINAIEGRERLRIGSIELRTISDALLKRMAAPSHCLVPFLHIPLQSGADRILDLMGRGYSAAAYAALVARAREQISGLCVGADILVGFPGETDADFDHTCRILEDGVVDYAHVFQYSDRPGTPAEKMPGKIPPPLMQARSARVRALSDANWQRFCQRRIGQTVRVLFEDMESGRWLGYTGNYIRVAAQSQETLANQFRNVRLESVEGDIMQGSIV